MNGFWWTVETVAGIVPWLKKAIAHFYPNSFYAAYLRREVRERAAKRLLQRPKTGFSVICPQLRRTPSPPLWKLGRPRLFRDRLLPSAENVSLTAYRLSLEAGVWATVRPGPGK